MKWFKGSKAPPSDPRADIEDLITQGELEEADRLLRVRLKQNAEDIYSRIRLADVAMKLGKQRDAVDEYLIAAESYARDGFFDKASALLRKIEKLAPSNENIGLKIEALKKAKALERRRDMVVTALLEGREGRGRRGASTLELQQLWTDLCKCDVIDRLSDDQVLRLATASELIKLDEGEQWADLDESRDELLILGKGSIEAKVELKNGNVTTLRAFSAGDLIGDRALLEHKSWPARYVADKRTTALKLTREGLARALTGETDPKGFLDTLRLQRHDHQVVSAMRDLDTAG